MNRSSSKIYGRRCPRSPLLTHFGVILVGAALAAQPCLMAADGIWTQATSGNLWGVSANWSGNAIADGSGFTADFSTLDLAGDTTVRLDTARIIGNLLLMAEASMPGLCA